MKIFDGITLFSKFAKYFREMKNNQDLQKLKDDVFLQSEEYVKNRDKAESAKDYVSIRIVK